jgi:hypothetical protein
VGECDHGRTHPRQLPCAQHQLVEAGGERRATLLAPEVGCERLHRTIVDAELAAGSAAGREQEQRPAPRPAQLGIGEVDRAAGEVGEDGVGVAELPLLEPGKDVVHRVHRRIMS